MGVSVGGTRKKLIEAAEHWATADRVDESKAKEDAAGFGIPEQPHDESENVCEVWDENWDILMMFLKLQTQWNTTMAGYSGLNYQSLEWFCRVYNIEDVSAMVDGIRIMEAAALKQLNSTSEG